MSDTPPSVAAISSNFDADTPLSLPGSGTPLVCCHGHEQCSGAGASELQVSELSCTGRVSTCERQQCHMLLTASAVGGC